MNGSTTARVAATATAASTALPPTIRARRPAWEARLWAELTTPRTPMAGGRNAPPWGPRAVVPGCDTAAVIAIAYLLCDRRRTMTPVSGCAAHRVRNHRGGDQRRM